MPASGLCRAHAESSVTRRAFISAACRHNQRASRKASSLSLGRVGDQDRGSRYRPSPKPENGAASMFSWSTRKPGMRYLKMPATRSNTRQEIHYDKRIFPPGERDQDCGGRLMRLVQDIECLPQPFQTHPQPASCDPGVGVRLPGVFRAGFFVFLATFARAVVAFFLTTFLAGRFAI